MNADDLEHFFGVFGCSASITVHLAYVFDVRGYGQWRLPAACVWVGLCVNAYGERRAEEKVKQVK